MFLEHQISILESCDTEDWSNDAENTAAHHRNKLHFKIYIEIENGHFKYIAHIMRVPRLEPTLKRAIA